MESQYLIVIFKNKKQYKVIKKYRKIKTADAFFDKIKKESDDIFFSVELENGRDVKYELAILERNDLNSNSVFITDDLGRNIKVELDSSNYSIRKIIKYNYPELITNYDTKERLDGVEFVSKYLKGSNLKLLSKLNNKVLLQDDDKHHLFIYKSIYDAERFLDNLSMYLMKIKKVNSIIVKDTDIAQKKYLYRMLTELGYDKKMLYRVSTTHLKEK